MLARALRAVLAGSCFAAAPAVMPMVALASTTVVGWPQDATPKPPPGFEVGAFARGLDSPRNLLVLPNGDVLVAESRTVWSPERLQALPPESRARVEAQSKPSADRITLLRDTDRDGVADLRTVLLDNLNQPYGMAIRRDRLYVANTDGVLSCPFFVGQTRITGACRQLFDLPAGAHDTHWTRNLVLSPDESQLYVAVGSATDADDEQVDVKEPRRAAILAASLDGRNVQVYASGLGNPVGLAFEPVTGHLWTTVGESHGVGDERVTDYMTAVRRGAFARTTTPDFAFDAHSASLGLAFYRREVYPKRYRGGAFVAQRGSSNGSSLAGYRVVFVPFENGRPSGDDEDFLTGFVKDAEAGEVYGRPVGVAVTKDGALLVADDAGNTIWRVQNACKACRPDPEPPAARR